jgi:hypothetical protein
MRFGVFYPNRGASMPTQEVIRKLGEKLRELIPEEVVATTEMQALVLRLALMETSRRSHPAAASSKANPEPRMAS